MNHKVITPHKGGYLQNVQSSSLVKYGRKDYAISMMRMLSMLMIIACHIFQHFDNAIAFWLNVGVQIFFVISGYLYGQKEISSPLLWFWIQFKKIVIMYYFFIFLITVLLILFHPENFNMYDTIKSILGVGTLRGFGHLWFVGYIIFCYLLTPFLQYLCKLLIVFTFKKIIFITLVLIFLYQIYSSLLNMYFIPSRVLCYVLGYVLGFYYYRNKKLLSCKMLFFCGIVTFVLNVLYIVLNVMERDIPGMGLLYGYSHLMLGGMLFLLGLKLFSSVRQNPILDFSDKYSYAIYIVHGTFALSVFNVLDISTPLYVNVIIVFVLSILGGVLLKTIERIMIMRFSI